MSTVTSRQPLPSSFARGRAGTLTAGCIAIAIAIAVPGLTPNLTGLISAKLQISGTELNWVGDVGFVGAAAATYLFGSLADRVGRRRVLLIGAIIIAVGEVIAGLATSVDVMYVGQTLAGIGAGCMSAISLAVVAAVGGTPDQRARHMAAFAGSLTAGPIMSSLLGGLLSQGSSYAWAFIGMGIIALVAGIAIYLLAAESRREQPARIDVAGQVILIVCLVSLLWAVIQGAGTSWTSAGVIAAFIVAVVTAVVFVLIERRPGGMISLSMFRRPAFSIATATALVSGYTFVGTGYIYAIRVTVGQGHSALFSAWGLIIEAVVAGGVGFASRRALQQRFGVQTLVTGGFGCFAVAGFWLASVPITDSSFTAMLGVMIMTGFGQAATAAGMSAAAVGSVAKELESEAASTQGVMRQAGPPLGVAISGAIIFGMSQSSLASAIGHLGLPASVSHAAAGVNAQAGVLGVFGSGMAAKVPSLGQAAVGAIGTGLGDAAMVIGIVSVVMAVVTGFGLRGYSRAHMNATSAVADLAGAGAGEATR